MTFLNIKKVMHSPRVEPQKRLVGGVYGWAVHRFPIKGGISLSDTMRSDICRPSTLFLRCRKP